MALVKRTVYAVEPATKSPAGGRLPGVVGTPNDGDVIKYVAANARYEPVAAVAGYSDEQAQDAVGGILVDSSEINFTYTDATPEITATLIDGSIAAARLNTAAKTVTIPFIIDGGGVVITTGVKGGVHVPFGCTIVEVVTLALDNLTGSIVVDIWKDSYTNHPPTVADTITASAKPTISAATKAKDSTLTGWTTSVSADDILFYNVDSVTTLTRVLVSLKVTRT